MEFQKWEMQHRGMEKRLMNESQAKQLDQSKKAKAPMSPEFEAQFKKLQADNEILVMRVNDYRSKFEREHAAHMKTGAALTQTRATYDILKGILSALEFDQATRVWTLGEEVQDYLDQGRKACGVK